MTQIAYIEASPDNYWGAGVLITSPSLDTGPFGGRNELGKRLMRVRTRLIAEDEIPNRNRTEMPMEAIASLPLIAGTTLQAATPPTTTPLFPTTALVHKGRPLLPANTAPISDSIENIEENIPIEKARH